jgi:hypothetical protein
MFRRLYWVSEQVHKDGSSKVIGVYTSIPDLVRHGLRYPDAGTLRLTLTKLDSDREPLGTWSSPSFEGIETAMEPFVKTEEFSVDQVKSLVSKLSNQPQAVS